MKAQVSAAPSSPSRKMATNFLMHEKIWFDKFKYDDAERKFYEQMNGPVAGSSRQVGLCWGHRASASPLLQVLGPGSRPSGPAGSCACQGQQPLPLPARPPLHASGTLRFVLPAELSFCAPHSCFPHKGSFYFSFWKLKFF